MLRDSGVFEYTWQELELWLSHLTGLLPAQQEAVIHFLERVGLNILSYYRISPSSLYKDFNTAFCLRMCRYYMCYRNRGV